MPFLPDALCPLLFYHKANEKTEVLLKDCRKSHLLTFRTPLDSGPPSTKLRGVYRNQLVRLSVCPVKKFTLKKKFKMWGLGY